MAARRGKMPVNYYQRQKKKKKKRFNPNFGFAPTCENGSICKSKDVFLSGCGISFFTW